MTTTTSPDPQGGSDGGYIVRNGSDGRAGIYLRKFNVRIATFADNTSVEQERIAGILTAAALGGGDAADAVPPYEPTEAMSTAGKHYMKGQDELYERQQAIGCWHVMYNAWLSAHPSPDGLQPSPSGEAVGDVDVVHEVCAMIHPQMRCDKCPRDVSTVYGAGHPGCYLIAEEVIAKARSSPATTEAARNTGAG